MQHNLFIKKNTSCDKELRDYQVDAVEAVFDFFNEKDGSPLIVIPTGGGKSLIIAEFIKMANILFPGTRIIVVSHAAILLEQNSEELLSQYPDANISFYSDSMGQKDLSADVVFAGIQSIYKKAFDFYLPPDLVLIDEAHTLGPDDGSMYRKFLNDLIIVNPNVKFVGLTATPFRAGYGFLHRGKNSLFTDIAYEISILELINRGHLCPIITPTTTVKMDTAGVGKRGGDYIVSQLARAVDDDALTKACIDEVLHHGQSRRKGLIFTVDIQHCTHVYQELSSRGEKCEYIHSKMDGSECNRAIDRFRSGESKYLINVAMLTTGANFPDVDLLAFMRPTRSPVLYIQMAGRGMRTFPGKSDCLLLDFGGVVEDLGPIDAVHVPQKGDGEGEAPIKFCEACGKPCAAGCAECPYCGNPFPENGLNLDANASHAAAISTQLKAKSHTISKVAYYRHQKEGKPDTLRIDYLCGFETYREWQCFEHSYGPRERACMWWKERGATTPPNTITEALSRTKELHRPIHVHVKKVGKYNEVIGVDFNEMEDIDEL